MSEVDELVALYQQATTEKQKAEVEAKVWAAAPPDMRKSFNRKDYLSLALNVNKYEPGCRQAVLSLGVAGDELWDRIHSGKLSLNAASKLAAKARKLRSLPLAEAVKSVLKEYDDLPNVCWVGGIPTRRPALRKTDKRTAAAEANERSFWESYRGLVEPYVKGRLKNTDPLKAEVLWRAFEKDFRILLDDFQRRLSRVEQEAREGVEAARKQVTRVKLLDACNALHMDPPRLGEPVDLKMAAQQKKRLVRLYHPDAHGGDESTRPEYEAVLAAFDSVESYNQQFSNGVANGQEDQR